MNHDLDVIHDTSPEGVFTLVKESPTSKGWFPGFPYGHPDPTLPQVIFNHQNEKFQDRDVRWALALALDIKAIVMASYRGAATISAIAIPPTGTAPDYYHEPMQEWLTDFEIDTGKQTIKPYDGTITTQIAEMLRPSVGDQIPTTEEEIGAAFGLGWWKQDLDAAAELMERAGFTKQGGKWMTPDGQPFKVSVMVEGEARPVMTRAGSMIAEQWRRFGVDATTDAAQAAFLTRRNGGDFEVAISWAVETGRASRSQLLPRQLALAVREACGRGADAAQLVALVEPRARPHHRGNPRDGLRRSEGDRARPGVREARRPGNAGHPAHVLQRVHDDGRNLLDRLPDRGRPLHQSRAELGQLPVHDGAA